MGNSSSFLAQDTWVIGVILALLADILSNSGTNLQKLAHTHLAQALKKQQAKEKEQKDKEEEGDGTQIVEADNLEEFPEKPKVAQSYTRSPIWILGIVLLVLSAIFDFLALTFANQSIVAPLGSLTLVVNLFLARWMHGEVITKLGVLATLMIVAGAFLTVLFADHTDIDLDVNGILDLYFTTRFIVYALVMIGAITTIWLMCKKTMVMLEVLEKQNNAQEGKEEFVVVDSSHTLSPSMFKLAVAALNGTLGGHNVLFAKLTVELFTAAATKCSPGLGMAKCLLLHPMFYMTLGMLVMTIVTQLRWLNEGLKRFDAVFMIPVSTSFWVFFSVFSGILTTGEYVRMSASAIGFFTLGMLFIISGVLIFTRMTKAVVKIDKNLKQSVIRRSSFMLDRHSPLVANSEGKNPLSRSDSAASSPDSHDKISDDQPIIGSPSSILGMAVPEAHVRSKSDSSLRKVFKKERASS